MPRDALTDYENDSYSLEHKLHDDGRITRGRMYFAFGKIRYTFTEATFDQGLGREWVSGIQEAVEEMCYGFEHGKATDKGER
jgi:hypothetical protein